MLCPYCHSVLRADDPEVDQFYCATCDYDFVGCEADDVLRDDGTRRYRDYEDTGDGYEGDEE